jgi:hypothetical protein
MQALMKILSRAGGEGKNIIRGIGSIAKPAEGAAMAQGGKMGAIADLLKANKLGAGALGGGAALGAGALGGGAAAAMGDDEEMDLEELLESLKKKGVQ